MSEDRLKPAKAGRFTWDFPLMRMVYTGVYGSGALAYHRLKRLRGQIPAEAIAERHGRSGAPSGRSPLWVHASSMGEVRVAAGLIGQLSEVRPEAEYVCSVSTETGHRLAGNIMPGRTVVVRAAVDLPGAIRSFLNHYHPAALILIETEWWPNQLRECDRRGLPVFVANGRVSATSTRHYRWVRRYLEPLLNRVERFYMRSSADAERLLSLGVDPDLVEVTGSIKNVADPQQLVARSALPEGPPVFMAGCTRPGEEAIVLEAFRRCRREIPQLRLWLAPRHPERFAEAAELIKQSGLSWAAYSVFPLKRLSAEDSPAVMLIDKMGVLAELYELAQVAFVGGSLRPFGGHNPVEPVLAGAPSLFGLYTEEQADAAAALEQAGLGVRVSDADSLARAVIHAVQNPPDFKEWNDRRREFFAGFSGAARRVAADIFARMDSLQQETSAGVGPTDGKTLG